MEVYNKPNKFIFIILLLILSNQLFSQSLGESYVTKDTVTINKPIIIMIKGYDGKFILSEDLLESTKNIQRAIENHQIFLYNDDGIGFISSKDRQKNSISIGECSYIQRNENKNLIIMKLPSEINKFYLGFVKPNFYNKRVITSNNKKTYLKEDDDFKPILYPICR
ncbi:hypothetical protein [Chryseobacterium sp. NKUCC03_KSP]|uniref:hypothetical protein n=1 Tax=Chryseobacterium sp. NKUCC03_KSP TaxID=2842125 RepID=UPI001C5BF7F4|nr:hypothetical protein [Chryseobacterium sp. NKUCC03_KSP]MBW3523084.1 hypothetical protein [Chryseobacterium sp. NKUCC03_KSP]